MADNVTLSGRFRGEYMEVVIAKPKPNVFVRVRANFDQFVEATKRAAQALAQLGYAMQAHLDTDHFYRTNPEARDQAAAYEAFVADGGDPEFIDLMEEAFDVDP